MVEIKIACSPEKLESVKLFTALVSVRREYNQKYFHNTILWVIKIDPVEWVWLNYPMTGTIAIDKKLKYISNSELIAC